MNFPIFDREEYGKGNVYNHHVQKHVNMGSTYQADGQRDYEVMVV